MTESKWIPVTRELLDEQHEWLYKPMWIALEHGPVVTGKYEWWQGWHPDRFVSVECGDVWAFDASHVMEIIPPKKKKK